MWHTNFGLMPYICYLSLFKIHCKITWLFLCRELFRRFWWSAGIRILTIWLWGSWSLKYIHWRFIGSNFIVIYVFLRPFLNLCCSKELHVFLVMEVVYNYYSCITDVEYAIISYEIPKSHYISYSRLQLLSVPIQLPGCRK